MSTNRILKKLSIGIASLALVFPLSLNASQPINAKVRKPATAKISHRNYRSKLAKQIGRLAKEDSHEYAPGYYPSKSRKKAKRYFRHMKWVTNTLFKKEDELNKLIYSHLKYESKGSNQGRINFLKYDMKQLQGEATSLFGNGRRIIRPRLSKSQQNQIKINDNIRSQKINHLNNRWSKDARQLKSIKINLINESIRHNKKLLKRKHVNHAKILKLLTKEYKSLKFTKKMNVTNMPIRILD